MKRLLLSAIMLCMASWIMAQPQGGFGGFQAPQVKLETSKEWKDVNYAGDDQSYHTCDIYLPKKFAESYPVVIHIYGSAWFSNNSKGTADLGTIVKTLLESGYAVVCPNHRSSMDAKWPAQIHDVRAVIRFIRGEAAKYKFDSSFIATSGFSSGGHLASIAATTSGLKQAKVGTVDVDLEGTIGNYLQESSVVNAACDWSGPVDLTAMDCGEHMTMGDNSPEDVLLASKITKEPDKYLSLSATNYVDSNDPPIIIFHGEKDNVVPCCQGKKFFELLKAAGVKTMATFVPEGSHGGPQMYTEENLKKMVHFLDCVRQKKLCCKGDGCCKEDGCCKNGRARSELSGITSSAHKMTSPNGRITVAHKGSVLIVSYEGQQALQLEELSIVGGGFTFVRSVKEDYHMLMGKRLHCTNEANEYMAGIGEDCKIILRLYNDGIALRYDYPKGWSGSDPTVICIPEGTRRWMQQWTDSYEGFFPLSTTYKVQPVPSFSGISKSEEGYNNRWGFPALLEPADGLFTLITEANIERGQSAACLYNDKEFFRVVTADRQDGNTCEYSPWRVVIIGSLKDIVESTLVTDVSNPSQITDTSWIHPGTVSWVYWAYNHGSNDYNIIKKYVDMAVEMRLPYVLIDAEWDQMGQLASNGGKTIEDAITYAKSKGVKPLIWYNSSVGWVDGAPTPKYRLNKTEDREKEFAWCEKVGVAGVKIDFFSGDNQMNMEYCLDLLESAARHNLLVNFHGATIPRGWQRTWPNLLSTEGVYGAEWYNNVASFTEKAAAHNATLPFTRNVVGSMDYTPCAFSDSQHPHITTHAHELALTVLFESGLQHLADKPESYLSQPQTVVDFISQLPVVWDETRFVSGYPGESVVLARRSGETWYIAGINGTDEQKKLDLPLKDILQKPFKAIAFMDAGNRSWQIMSSVSELPAIVTCRPRGGFVYKVSKRDDGMSK